MLIIEKEKGYHSSCCLVLGSGSYFILCKDIRIDFVWLEVDDEGYVIAAFPLIYHIEGAIAQYQDWEREKAVPLSLEGTQRNPLAFSKFKLIINSESQQYV